MENELILKNMSKIIDMKNSGMAHMLINDKCQGINPKYSKSPKVMVMARIR